jgi:hypothetical protein
MQVSSGLLPDGRHFVSRARDEAAQWRQLYKAPIPVSSLADRMGSYAQAYTLYSSVRPFGITAIIAGWDSEAELPVDGQVGTGPSTGSGGKKEGAKHGGPSLYMIEPSGLYWVCNKAGEFDKHRLIRTGLLRGSNGQGSSNRQIRAREVEPRRRPAIATGGCQGGSAHHLRCARRQ